MSQDNVVPLKPEFGQLELPGMPIAGFKLVMKSTKNSLPVIETFLKPNTAVSGTFKGRVLWPDYSFDDGILTQVIEVLTAELDEA